jgi:hypothetical protein
MIRLEPTEWLSSDCRILLYFGEYADAWKVCIQEENETKSKLHKTFEEFEEAKEYIENKLKYKF